MKILVLLLICYTVNSQSNGGDLESLIKEIFGDPNKAAGGSADQPAPNPPSDRIPASTASPSTTGSVNLNPAGVEDLSCKTDDGEEGECVHYYLCNTNNSIITDGVGIIDIRVRDGPCESYLDTCCLLPDRRPPDNPITPPPPTKEEDVPQIPCQITEEHKIRVIMEYEFRRGSNAILTARSINNLYGENKTTTCAVRYWFDRFRTGIYDLYSEESQLKSIMEAMDPAQCISHEGCGWRNPDGIGFRIKGDTDNEAKFGEFPWMVAILKIEPVNDEEPDGQKLNVYVGGGSLIHPNVVLTAAHYVTGRKNLKIRAGEWDTQTKKEIYPYQDRDVKEVIVHKDFNSGSLFYDIAILILSEPLELAPNVGLACLPEAKQRATAGVRCFASGWGKDQFGKNGRYQVILKKVEVPVVERRTCESQLQKTRLGRNFRLHTSFMCAGGEPGRDTCKGDGGSPLVCPIESEKGRYQQNGIVAWGIGCGEDGTPGVYVDVANLRDWIDDVVAGKGYSTKSYSLY